MSALIVTQIDDSNTHGKHMPGYKPAAYNSVSSYLIVTDAAGTISFLQQVFDAKLLRNFKDESGKYMHAEVQIDDTVLMLADQAPQWPAMPSYVHIYVPDVDATYARALEAGACAVQAPIQKGDQDKRGGVRDIGSTTWWIATQQAEIKK